MYNIVYDDKFHINRDHITTRIFHLNTGTMNMYSHGNVFCTILILCLSILNNII